MALLNEFLQSGRDLALLKHETDKRWKAMLDYTLVEDGRYTIWHVPGGPLPLLAAEPFAEPLGLIDDPFAGWEQLRIDGHGQPFLGSTPNVIHINLRVTQVKPGHAFGLSSIEWIGSYFWALGRVAPDVTKKRWNRLRAQFSKAGPRVPRGSLTSDGKAEIFALPSAYQQLAAGAKGDLSAIRNYHRP